MGPKRRFTALQRYVRSWSTSRHSVDIVNVRLRPRHASLIGSGRRSSLDSLAMLAAMRLASSRVGSTSPSRRRKTIRLDQVHPPGNSELPLDQDTRRSTAVTCTGVQTPPRAVAMTRAHPTLSRAAARPAHPRQRRAPACDGKRIQRPSWGNSRPFWKLST
jgi:hypothetical protein